MNVLKNLLLLVEVSNRQFVIEDDDKSDGSIELGLHLLLLFDSTGTIDVITVNESYRELVVVAVFVLLLLFVLFSRFFC